MLKLYNTLTRKKETFKPIHDKAVGMYTCGPTVYWYQHIGNLRSYVFPDILKRILEYDGYKVKQVINITDVGHLTSDADEGEDKIEKAAKKEGKKAEDIANYYFSIFLEDLKKINVIEPTVWTKATEHIQDQIKLIKKLEDKGYTYKTEDGIYFDTSKFKNYGKLGRLNIEKLQAGKRISMGDKKNKTDFALWKFSDPDAKEKRQQEWKSPWGIGFPGWHIECSAMSMKYLGDHFDIHTGGEDHIQVHHSNEIAQSECATGKKFVNYWVHGAFLTTGGEKVSKSKGGLFTLSELEKKGFEPMSYRYFVLTTVYRKPLEFSMENLQNSQNSYRRLKNIVSGLKDDKKTNKKYLKEFVDFVNDDLDTPNALQVLWKFLRDENAQGKFRTVKEMDKILGLKLFEKEDVEISESVKKLIDERENARKEKNWKKADELRDKIKKKGYSVEDTKEGVVVKKL
jgi:cysteinyl-tRNA synthetase